LRRGRRCTQIAAQLRKTKEDNKVNTMHENYLRLNMKKGLKLEVDQKTADSKIGTEKLQRRKKNNKETEKKPEPLNSQRSDIF
jgi:hypothetical protein